MAKPSKQFKGPGTIGQIMATLEAFDVVKPVTGHNWTFAQALDMHFYPLPDWLINGLCIAILVYALTLYHLF